MVSQLKCVVKIGVSSNPMERLRRLNEEAIDHNFELVSVRDFENNEDCLLMEKYLHDKYRDFRVVTGYYGGYTETFDINILEEVVAFLSKVTNTFKRIDPFLTLNNGFEYLKNLPDYENLKYSYNTIMADLLLAKLNGNCGLIFSGHFYIYTKYKTKYKKAWFNLTESKVLMYSDYEDILTNLSITDITISYRDSMIGYLKSKHTSLYRIISTISVMEYFFGSRQKTIEFARIMKSRGLKMEDVNAMKVAYKQVMKTDMNCRLDVK